MRHEKQTNVSSPTNNKPRRIPVMLSLALAAMSLTTLTGCLTTQTTVSVTPESLEAICGWHPGLLQYSAPQKGKPRTLNHDTPETIAGIRLSNQAGLNRDCPQFHSQLAAINAKRAARAKGKK